MANKPSSATDQTDEDFDDDLDLLDTDGAGADDWTDDGIVDDTPPKKKKGGMFNLIVILLGAGLFLGLVYFQMNQTSKTPQPAPPSASEQPPASPQGEPSAGPLTPMPEFTDAVPMPDQGGGKTAPAATPTPSTSSGSPTVPADQIVPPVIALTPNDPTTGPGTIAPATPAGSGDPSPSSAAVPDMMAPGGPGDQKVPENPNIPGDPKNTLTDHPLDTPTGNKKSDRSVSTGGKTAPGVDPTPTPPPTKGDATLADLQQQIADLNARLATMSSSPAMSDSSVSKADLSAIKDQMKALADRLSALEHRPRASEKSPPTSRQGDTTASSDNTTAPDTMAPDTTAPDTMTPDTTTPSILSKDNATVGHTPSHTEEAPSASPPTPSAKRGRYVLRAVSNGTAYIARPDSATLVPVQVGDAVEGFGTVKDMRQSADGRWQVITTAGTIRSK